MAAARRGPRARRLAVERSGAARAGAGRRVRLLRPPAVPDPGPLRRLLLPLRLRRRPLRLFRERRGPRARARRRRARRPRARGSPAPARRPAGRPRRRDLGPGGRLPRLDHAVARHPREKPRRLDGLGQPRRGRARARRLARGRGSRRARHRASARLRRGVVPSRRRAVEPGEARRGRGQLRAQRQGRPPLPGRQRGADRPVGDLSRDLRGRPKAPPGGRRSLPPRGRGRAGAGRVLVQPRPRARRGRTARRGRRLLPPRPRAGFRLSRGRAVPPPPRRARAMNARAVDRAWNRFLLLGAAILVFYGVLLWAPMIYDDRILILGNPRITGPWGGFRAALFLPGEYAEAWEPLVVFLHRILYAVS